MKDMISDYIILQYTQTYPKGLATGTDASLSW